MTSIAKELVDDIVDAYIDEQRQHEAFGQALLALFKLHIPPEFSSRPDTFSYSVIRGVRGAAYRQAKVGAYKDFSAQVLTGYALGWRVPPAEVLAVHTLIYG